MMTPPHRKASGHVVDAHSPESRADAERTAEVIVLGGGLAGLTCALQIRQARPVTSLVVVARSTFPGPETTHKVRESTVGGRL
jgi:hypothetical protein